MAVRDLQELLLEVELELEQNASAYRKLVSDKKAHSLYVTKKGSVRLISLKFGVGVILFLADGYSLGKYGYDIITTSEDEKQRRLFFSKLLGIEN